MYFYFFVYGSWDCFSGNLLLPLKTKQKWEKEQHFGSAKQYSVRSTAEIPMESHPLGAGGYLSTTESTEVKRSARGLSWSVNRN